MTAKKHRAPAHLQPATRAWFVSVAQDYALEQHHFRLLQLAAEAWDRSQEAREILAKDGIIVNGREGPKPHPAVAIERDSRLAFARLVRELDLDVDAPVPDRIGPVGLRSNRRA